MNNKALDVTLESLTGANRLNAWIAEQFLQFAGSKLLEIGSGTGNISRLLPTHIHRTLSDIAPDYLETLNAGFKENPHTQIIRLDIGGELPENLTGCFDTVLCINVLEHIKDDKKALQNLFRLLEPGGRLFLLIPQHPWLYGNLDTQLGHFRRYTRKDLDRKLKKSGFRILHLRNFNSLGIAGWYLNSVLRKKNDIEQGQVRIFDLCVPLLRFLEKYLPLPGLSLISLAQKPLLL